MPHKSIQTNRTNQNLLLKKKFKKLPMGVGPYITKTPPTPASNIKNKLMNATNKNKALKTIKGVR